MDLHVPSLKLLGQNILEYMQQLHKVLEINMTSDLEHWPTYLKFDRGHLLIMDYVPTNFETI